MKKTVLAMMVAGVSLMAGMSAANAASTTTVSGGTVQFKGQVVDAACAVSSDSVDQVVIMGQARTARLTTVGEAAGQKQAFTIKLEDCDSTVSQNAAVMFNGQGDANQDGVLANTAGAGAAKNVALQLYGPDGNILAMGETSSTITLIDGENIIPLSVDYIATGEVTPGNVEATATFNMVYS